jgi:hypothetical protein
VTNPSQSSTLLLRSCNDSTLPEISDHPGIPSRPFSSWRSPVTQQNRWRPTARRFPPNPRLLDDAIELPIATFLRANFTSEGRDLSVSVLRPTILMLVHDLVAAGNHVNKRFTSFFIGLWISYFAVVPIPVRLMSQSSRSGMVPIAFRIGFQTSILLLSQISFFILFRVSVLARSQISLSVVFRIPSLILFRIPFSHHFSESNSCRSPRFVFPSSFGFQFPWCLKCHVLSCFGFCFLSPFISSHMNSHHVSNFITCRVSSFVPFRVSHFGSSRVSHSTVRLGDESIPECSLSYDGGVREQGGIDWSPSREVECETRQETECETWQEMEFETRYGAGFEK